MYVTKLEVTPKDADCHAHGYPFIGAFGLGMMKHHLVPVLGGSRGAAAAPTFEYSREA